MTLCGKLTCPKAPGGKLNGRASVAVVPSLAFHSRSHYSTCRLVIKEAVCFFSSFSRWMYWTDWEEDPKESKRGRIERAWMDGSNRNVFLTSKTVLWPNGLSLDIPQGILYWVDAFYDRIEMVYLNSSERKVSTSCRHRYFTAVWIQRLWLRWPLKQGRTVGGLADWGLWAYIALMFWSYLVWWSLFFFRF